MSMVKLADALAVVARHPWVLTDVLANRKLPSIASEILGDVPSVLKAIHDIGKFRRVRQPERMPGFVKAGKVNDGLAEQSVARRLGRRQDVHFSAADPVDNYRPRFSVQALVALGPIH